MLRLRVPWPLRRNKTLDAAGEVREEGRGKVMGERGRSEVREGGERRREEGVR